jgi:uncharacterized protein (TIGR02284 family)
MADSTTDFISTLNDLIETCKDGEQGFRDAADGVTRSDLRSLFSEFARQRTQFANELQVQVSRLGGDPEKGGSVSGSLHRGWINLKSAITGKDDHAILAECERGEDAAVKSYQSALERDLPSDLRSIVERQYNDILDCHNRIKAMRDQSGTTSSRVADTVDEVSSRRTY